MRRLVEDITTDSKQKLLEQIDKMTKNTEEENDRRDLYTKLIQEIRELITEQKEHKDQEKEKKDDPLSKIDQFRMGIRYINECTDVSFKERLTRKDILEVIAEWKSFEEFAIKLVSLECTDDACLKNAKQLLKLNGEQSEKKEAAANMAQYMYRMEDSTNEHFTGEEGEDEEELWGQTFLHLAICFEKTETAKVIATNAPVLLSADIGKWPDNKQSYVGLTPFHIAVAHGEYDFVEKMVNVSKVNRDVSFGQRTNGTVFMGQLPLHIAVLSYINDNNKEDTFRDKENRFVKVIKILIDGGHKLEERNRNGDTVLHSIMRFVHCFPLAEARAVDMMEYLPHEKKKQIFFVENNEGKTALQLATEFGHPGLFKHFMKLQGVYHILLPHDDIYEIRRFDVTEFDKIAMILSQQEANNDSDQKSNDAKNTGGCQKQTITELLCCLPLQTGSRLVRADVFEEIIKRKRKRYISLFRGFFGLHFALLVIFCVFAVARAETERGNQWPEIFLNFCNGLTFVSAFIYLFQEIYLRCYLSRQPFAMRAIHHNVLYRVLILIFGTCLAMDGIMYRIPGSFDYRSIFLIIALVVGTWFLMFFFRMSRFFSTYVVHINESLIKTVIPFTVLILLQVFVFSTCMHSAFLHSEDTVNKTVVDQFETYGKSLLTMGKLMIGLTEVEKLLDSREDVIVVVLFIVFTVVTFLLMINALIGVMTNRFGDTHTNHQMVLMIQRLSVMIFIEGWFIGIKWFRERGCLRIFGPRKTGDRIEGENISCKVRYVMSYRKVSSKAAGNPDNNEHHLRQEWRKGGEVADKIDRLLEVQEAKDYDGHRALHIYHYDK